MSLRLSCLQPGPVVLLSVTHTPSEVKGLRGTTAKYRLARGTGRPSPWSCPTQLATQLSQEQTNQASVSSPGPFMPHAHPGALPGRLAKPDLSQRRCSTQGSVSVLGKNPSVISYHRLFVPKITLPARMSPQAGRPQGPILPAAHQSVYCESKSLQCPHLDSYQPALI